MDYLYTLQCLRESAPDVLNYFLLYVSEYGQYIGPALALVIYWCFSKKTGSWMLFSLGWGLTVMDTIKVLVCVPRPYLLDGRIQVAKGAEASMTGYSFPSGHTTAAATTYGTAAVYASNGAGVVKTAKDQKAGDGAADATGETTEPTAKNESTRTLAGIGTVKKRRIWATVLLVLAVLLVAFARNWLGCHTVADVLAAMGIAAVVATIMYFVMKAADSRPKGDLVVAGVMAFIIVILMIFAASYEFPTVYDSAGNVLELDNYALSMDLWASMGICSGWILSWIVERRFINFSVEGTRKEKIVRAVVGVVVFGLFYLVLSGPMTAWIPNGHAAKFCKRFITVVIVGIGIPLCIRCQQDIAAKRTRLDEKVQ